MNASNIQILLERLGCTKIRTGTWVRATCPLAPLTHKDGTDNKPSFAVRVNETNHSGVNCFTCGFVGTLTTLIWKLSKGSSGSRYAALMDFVSKYDQVDPDELAKRIAAIPSERPPYQAVEVAGLTVSSIYAPSSSDPSEMIILDALDESILDHFKHEDEESREWFRNRGLFPETIATWELGWHPDKRRISIPVRDVKGRLVCVSGRAVDSDNHPKFLHSKGFKRDFYLFGEHRCQRDSVGYLVEGFFDVMMLWQKGYRNAMAFMGGSLSKFQVEKIVHLCKEVVILPDGDKPGYEIADRVYNALSPRLRARIAEIPHGKDPDQLSSEYLTEIIGEPQAAPLVGP